MIRIPGKPQKIAYKILGVPANKEHRRNAVRNKVNQQLIFEETVRVR